MIKTVHLIVSTEKTKTLNRDMHKVAVSACEVAGLHVHETDIYELYHNHHPAVLPYGIDISDAEHDDIEVEQNKMTSADLIIVQFPLYWFSMPGLLKNYFDRVWEKGVAYTDDAIKEPFLADRQILFSTTTGFVESDFNSHSKVGTLKEVLYPFERACQLVGLNVLTPYACYGVHSKTDEQIEHCINAYHDHIKTVVGTANLA